MPQEASTVNLIVKGGAAVLLQRASDIVPVVRRMIEDSKHYAALRAATITLAIPNATKTHRRRNYRADSAPAKLEEDLAAQPQLTETVAA